jgi:uncharacterized protein (TIGR02391 family)
MAADRQDHVKVAAVQALTIAKAIVDDAAGSGLATTPLAHEDEPLSTPNFDQIVDDDELRRTCRKLYLDGHYALAVEEAYKCLNNVVKSLSELALDGVDLMKNAFSANKPVLALNALQTQSEKDQQRGYMEIFSGVITGIRNPRAHEHAYLDDPSTALELLGLANHLVRTARRSRVVPRT